MKRLIAAAFFLIASMIGLYAGKWNLVERCRAAPPGVSQAPAASSLQTPAIPAQSSAAGAAQTSSTNQKVQAPPTPLPQNLPVFEAKDIARLRQMENQIVMIKGVVSEYRASWSDRAPNIVFLREGNETFEIVYWTDPSAPEKNPNLSQPGTPVHAAGKVQKYRGRWQLKVDNNAFISTQPLTPGRTPFIAQTPSPAAGAANATAAVQAPQPAGILWKPYNLQEIQQALAQKLPIMIYARSESLPRCHAIENTCLLHPEVAALAPGVTIFYVTVEDPSGAEVARALRIFRVPSLALFRDPQSIQTLPLSETSSRIEVASFLRSALSAPNAPAANTQAK